jgi:hypothetical protein
MLQVILETRVVLATARAIAAFGSLHINSKVLVPLTRPSVSAKAASPQYALLLIPALDCHSCSLGVTIDVLIADGSAGHYND